MSTGVGKQLAAVLLQNMEGRRGFRRDEIGDEIKDEWDKEWVDLIDAALRRAKAEGEDEVLKLRIYTQTLQRTLRNCHMLARRIVVSESAFFKVDSANHIIRMCEEAGITQDGVLRDARAAQIDDGEST